MKDDDEEVGPLTKGQLRNLIAAARKDPGSCDKAHEFIDKELGMGKKAGKKARKKKDETGPIERLISGKIQSKVSKAIDDFLSNF